MLEKTKGILLRTIKYGDTSLIASIYTEKFGRGSFIFKGIKSSKKKKPILHPLAQLELVMYHKATNKIHLVKEFSYGKIYATIPLNIYKSSITIFLAELLSKVLIEESPSNKLYDFLTYSLNYLDNRTSKTNLFSIVFLLKLTKYLGIKPQNNFTEKHQYFNIRKGKFGSQKASKYILDKEWSKVFSSLLDLNFNDSYSFPRNQTNYEILKIILDYYSLHLDNIKHLKSLEVLHQVFH